jgi:uncharacterized protein YndB with AHSA1/START domain
MCDILHELDIHAAPSKVYEAITQQEGLVSWWTADTRAKPEVGSVAEFGFDGGKFLIKMESAALEREPIHKIEWKALQGAPDWGGTKVTWELVPVEKGTKVLFGHRNYASTGGSFAAVNHEWGNYLSSLKKYLETGKGNPNLS